MKMSERGQITISKRLRERKFGVRALIFNLRLIWFPKHSILFSWEGRSD